MSGQILDLTNSWDWEAKPTVPPHRDGVEQVLCFAEKFFGWVGRPNPIQTEDVAVSLKEILSNGHLEFIDRDQAEVSEEWVQLIPYCVIRRGASVFVYRRKGTEGRLNGLRSIGVGGHINPVDSGQGSVYEAALRRELAEEVGIAVGRVPDPVALIYDPSNAVGKVHLGVVHNVRVPSSFNLTCNDPALESGEFVDLQTLKAHAEASPELFETWTALILPHLS